MEPSRGSQKRVVWWTANPRVPVEYAKQPREYNTQTKRQFWDACTEEDRVVLKQFAEVFQAKWDE